MYMVGMAALLVPVPDAVGLTRARLTTCCGCACIGVPMGRLRLRGGGDHAQRQLFQAAQRGDIAAIEAAVSHGAEIDASDPLGALAIHMASTRGHAEAVKVLLLLGASVDSRLRSGPTALHLAAEGGHHKTAVVLLENGAQVDLSLIHI